MFNKEMELLLSVSHILFIFSDCCYWMVEIVPEKNGVY